MKIKTALLLLAVSLYASASSAAAPYRTVIDRATAEKVNDVINRVVIPASGQTQGERISRVSSAFLNTPYVTDTLMGSAEEPEALVINFHGVDCFTLIDYVQALSQSRDRTQFLLNLTRTRYTDGEVSYLKRRHFFSDWFTGVPQVAQDVTSRLSPDAVTVVKRLNQKAEGGEYRPGLGIIPRRIRYIPARAINQQVLSRLKTGDYIGIYSPEVGLDVSHVGIAVRHDGKLWFRNASSRAAHRKVIDAPLEDYLRSTPGIIVVRAEPHRLSG